MCPDLVIDEHERLATVVELVHNANRNTNNEPIDFYRLHAYLTPTDEIEDDVADANQNVGSDFGYGRPDLGEYDLEGEVMLYYVEEYSGLFWPGPDLSWVREYESPAGSEVGSGDGEDGDEGESGRGEDEQAAGGDDDGGRMRTNTDSTIAATAAGEEQDLSTNSEHTNPDTPVAPASSNTNMQQATRLAVDNDASAGEVQAQND